MPGVMGRTSTVADMIANRLPGSGQSWVLVTPGLTETANWSACCFKSACHPPSASWPANNCSWDCLKRPAICSASCGFQRRPNSSICFSSSLIFVFCCASFCSEAGRRLMLHQASATDAAKTNSNNRRTFRSWNASGGNIRFFRGFCIRLVWCLGFGISPHHAFHKKLVRHGCGCRRTADRAGACSGALAHRGGSASLAFTQHLHVKGSLGQVLFQRRYRSSQNFGGCLVGCRLQRASEFHVPPLILPIEPDVAEQ